MEILKLVIFVILANLSIGCQSGKSLQEKGEVKFYVDPATNSDDADIRMAYGINIKPPWPDGGSFFVNLPEHLEYMPGTKGIARHHDQRLNAWEASSDSTKAHYSVESLTEPGVFFSVKAQADNHRVTFEMSMTNSSDKDLDSIRPLFCFQYNLLKGFPEKRANNFEHTYVVIDGKPISVASLNVRDSSAIARMAQVTDCPDEHNWWAEDMGGLIDQKLDVAYTILTSMKDDRKIILRWKPGKNLLTNAAIPCIHADPCIGDLPPGASSTVYGELIFTRVPLERILEAFPVNW
ncbi:MAG: hypothetical protein IPL46_13625 [Saprospiraceae bacterium]|nr:hypothetical protein [Saprospiraceae bacterium]